mgnify:CR=1 FL=1
MRPLQLDPLFKPVENLPGIGPRLAEALARVTGRDGPEDTKALDLLLLPPHGLIDRSLRGGITESPEGVIVTLKVRVDRHQPAPPGRRSAPYRVFVHDDTGEMALTFFHAKKPWLEKLLPVGETMLVSGRVEWFNGRPSMVHPDHIAPESEADSFPLIEPVYPLTAGLSAKVLKRSIDQAMELLPELPEWSDGHLVVLTERGDVVLVRATPAGHEEVARFAAIKGKTWNTPTIADGRLFVRNTTEMAAFDIAP